METKLIIFITLMALAALLMLAATGNLAELGGGSGRIPSTISEGTRIVSGVPQAIGEGGAILLLTGGLLVLLLMLPLTLMRAIHEGAQNVVQPNGGQPVTTSKYEMGFKMGSSIAPKHTDEIAETLESLEDSDVLVTSNGKTTKLRLKNCRSCDHAVCEFEKGFCAGAFGQLHGNVEVKETKCRALGAPFCEFEVKKR